MSEIKVIIGGKEYNVGPMKLADFRKCDSYRKKNRLDEFAYTVYLLWYCVDKYNPEVFKTPEEFENTVNLDEYPELEEKIREISGFKKILNLK